MVGNRGLPQESTFLGAVAFGAMAAMACSGADPTLTGAGGWPSAGGSGGQVIGNIGGTTSVGGNVATAVGGTTTTTANGGSAPAAGGSAATGGAAIAGGNTLAIGGSMATGGAPTSGGTGAVGGAASPIGGRLAGGANATGGALASGGTAPQAGGSSSVGGATSTGGATSQAGSAGAGNPTSPPKVCDEPTPWALPATSQVVGNGTAASCTASALGTAVTAGGHVTFNCGGAPVKILVAAAITASKATVVDGANLITLDGGGTNQIFLGASNNSLSVRNLRFINGKAPDNTEAAGIGGAVSGNWRSKVEVIGCTFEDNSAARGGGAVAVWTGSSLTIVSSRFYRNVSWYGGAVYSLLSPLLVTNSEFADNSTILKTGYGDGGAIGTDGASESPNDSLGGTVQICGTQIRSNDGNGSGGGAYIWIYPPDKAIIDRTSVEANTVVKNAAGQGSIGGAMRISNGEITIKDSSFLSNTSIGNGGGLYLDCAPTCTITNSTFYANKNSAGWGGAIFSGSTSNRFDINNSTFANNAQQNTQGNAFFGTATWNINNSIFLDNSCANAGTGAHVVQWVTASKSAGTGPCIAGVTAADPKLSVPADNGGPTYTMLPLAGSGALQVGATCEAADQRGQPRNVAACDLGSVEVL